MGEPTLPVERPLSFDELLEEVADGRLHLGAGAGTATRERRAGARSESNSHLAHLPSLPVGDLVHGRLVLDGVAQINGDLRPGEREMGREKKPLLEATERRLT